MHTQAPKQPRRGYVNVDDAAGSLIIHSAHARRARARSLADCCRERLTAPSSAPPERELEATAALRRPRGLGGCGEGPRATVDATTPSLVADAQRIKAALPLHWRDAHSVCAMPRVR